MTDKLWKIPLALEGPLGGMSRAAFYKSELSKLIIKIGRSSYLSDADIQAWIAEHRKKANKPAA